MANQSAPSDRDALLEQMTAIAQFGDRAFQTDDLQILLEEATELAAKGMAVSHAKALELMPDGKLLLRAGIGWRSGTIGTMLTGGSGSAAGYAILTGEPVISEDLERETRFELPELLRQHGIKSSVNVVIKGADLPFGVLEIDSDERRQFTQSDINVLQGYANLLAAAIHRLRANQKLKAVEEEKSLLFRELQHSVKNNLQMIMSIVRIQRAMSRGSEAKRSLETLMNRLSALSLVHKQLYARTDRRELALNNYVEELSSNLIVAANLGADHITLDLHLARIMVPIDLASSLGLIVNEFITNSMQHAFPDRRGTIRIVLERIDSNRVQMELADDGIGRSQNPDARSNSGLGLQLMQSLVDQIDGRIEWGSGPGTRATVTFPA